MEAGHTFFSGLYATKPLVKDDDYFYKARFYRLQNHHIMRYRSCPTTRNYSKGYKSNILNSKIIVRIFESGTFCRVDGEDVKQLGSDSVYISTEFIGAYTTPVAGVTVTVDAAACGFSHGEPIYRQVPRSSPMGRIVVANMLALEQAMPEASLDEAQQLFEIFCDLVQAVLRRGSVDGAARARLGVSRALAMRRFVEERLDDPMFRIGSLEEAFNASRSTVYRAFDEVGGVEQFLRRRRLDRAMMELVHAPPRRGIVSSVAESVGYPDQTHFSRLFRKQFGATPGDFVGLRLGSSQVLPEPTQCLEVQQTAVPQLRALFPESGV